MKLFLRPVMAFLAVGLTASAFRLTKEPLSLTMLATIFCIFCTARLQNDWRDRYHDVKKGKTFAYTRPKLFLMWLLSLWLVCSLLICFIALQSGKAALLLGAMATAGLLYSETRKIPWMPICISAGASASPAFLPLTLQSNLDRSLPLFAAAALLIFAREILKDFEDQVIDVGYKWTIPLAYGNRTAKWLAIMSTTAACAVAASISPLVGAGALLASIGMVGFLRSSQPATAMNWLDAGAAMVIAVLMAFPP